MQKMVYDIDPVQFGKMLAKLEELTEKVDKMSGHIDSLNERVSTGKGMLFGAALAAGGLGATAHALLGKFVEGLFK
jgi:hypothetical protein